MNRQGDSPRPLSGPQMHWISPDCKGEDSLPPRERPGRFPRDALWGTKKAVPSVAGPSSFPNEKSHAMFQAGDESG